MILPFRLLLSRHFQKSLQPQIHTPRLQEFGFVPYLVSSIPRLKEIAYASKTDEFPVFQEYQLRMKTLIFFVECCCKLKSTHLSIQMTQQEDPTTKHHLQM